MKKTGKIAWLNFKIIEMLRLIHESLSHIKIFVYKVAVAGSDAHPALLESWRNSWIWVSSPSMPRKLYVANCSRKPKYMFIIRTANYSLKLRKKHSQSAWAIIRLSKPYTKLYNLHHRA